MSTAPARLSPIGERWLSDALSAGWKQTAYAVREGCVSCPACEVLHNALPGLAECHSCKWKAAHEVRRS